MEDGKGRIRPPWGQPRWGRDPLLGLETIRDTMNEMFTDLFARARPDLPPPPMRPAVDLYREKDQLVVEASLPGAARGDLQIHVADNLLILHGTIPRENDIPEQDYLIRECRQGHFHRSIPLPAEVVPEGINAQLRSGVLRIRLPLRHPQPGGAFKVEVE